MKSFSVDRSERVVSSASTTLALVSAPAGSVRIKQSFYIDTGLDSPGGSPGRRSEIFRTACGRGSEPSEPLDTLPLINMSADPRISNYANRTGEPP